MNIRPRPGKLCDLNNRSHPPTQARFARAYFLQSGMFMPAPDCRPWHSQGSQAMPCVASRRDAIVAAVEAYNRTRLSRRHAIRPWLPRLKRTDCDRIGWSATGDPIKVALIPSRQTSSCPRAAEAVARVVPCPTRYGCRLFL